MLRSIVTAAVLFASTSAFAAAAKTYQVTGPVVEVTDSSITVLKGKSEKFNIAKDASTKSPAEVKVGDKVTVHYSMTATEIEAKAAKTKKAGAAKAETTEKKAVKTEKKAADKKVDAPAAAAPQAK